MSNDSSGIRPVVSERTVVARAGTLDGFAEAAAGPGLALRQLEPLTALSVYTRNTHYRIVVTRGDEILIQGGTFFPDPTPAHLEGSSVGGSLLKVGWIGVGLRLEIRAGGQRIVTTSVRSLAIDSSAPSRPN
jgi:hypothetical protein